MDEFTNIMHSELTVTKEEEDQLRAGCVWHVWCDRSSSKAEIEKYAEMYSISYETAIRWRDYWLKLYGK